MDKKKWKKTKKEKVKAIKFQKCVLSKLKDKKFTNAGEARDAFNKAVKRCKRYSEFLKKMKL